MPEDEKDLEGSLEGIGGYSNEELDEMLNAPFEGWDPQKGNITDDASTVAEKPGDSRPVEQKEEGLGVEQLNKSYDLNDLKKQKSKHIFQLALHSLLSLGMAAETVFLNLDDFSKPGNVLLKLTAGLASAIWGYFAVDSAKNLHRINQKIRGRSKHL